jgi:hypothetical protein
MTSAAKPRRAAPKSSHPGALRCRKKFLKFFPDGFYDETYLDWERDYKWEAHERWKATLSQHEFRALLKSGEYHEAARRAVNLESRTNLLFSFEKMALRDAVKSVAGARAFSEGLYEWIYAAGDDRTKFERWCEIIASLPRRQTRVLTWPLVTVFGFIALPEKHFFLTSELGHLLESAGIRQGCARGPGRSGPTRHDRHPIISVGPGFGRVRLAAYFF